MSFRTSLGLAAIVLVACSGSGAATPSPVPTFTPAPTITATATPVPTETPFPTVTPTIVSTNTPTPVKVVEVQCGNNPKNEVIYRENGSIKWRAHIGDGIETYSQRVAGVVIPRSTFECVAAGYIPQQGAVIAYGQDASGVFPAQLEVLDASNGNHVKSVFHPGHIKGAVLVRDVSTSKGLETLLVVFGVSNNPQLTKNQQPYVPVAMAIDWDAWTPVGYVQLGPTGQALFPQASIVGGNVIITYALDINGQRSPASLSLDALLTPEAAKTAQQQAPYMTFGK